MTFRQTLDTVFRPRNEKGRKRDSLIAFMVQVGKHTDYIPKIPSIFDIEGDLDERAKELEAIAHFNYPIIEHPILETGNVNLYLFRRFSNALDFFVLLNGKQYKSIVGEHPLMRLSYVWNPTEEESQFKLRKLARTDLEKIIEHINIKSPHISKDGTTLICDREKIEKF